MYIGDLDVPNSVVPLAANGRSDRRMLETTVTRLRGEFMAQNLAADAIRTIELCLQGVKGQEASRLHRTIWSPDLEAVALELRLDRYPREFEIAIQGGDIFYTAEFHNFILDVSHAPGSSERRLSITPKPGFSGGGGSTQIELNIDISAQLCSVTAFAPPERAQAELAEASALATSYVIFICGHSGCGKSSLATDTFVSNETPADTFVSYVRHDRVALIEPRLLLARFLDCRAGVWLDDEAELATQSEQRIIAVMLAGIDDDDGGIVRLTQASQCASTLVMWPGKEGALDRGGRGEVTGGDRCLSAGVVSRRRDRPTLQVVVDLRVAVDYAALDLWFTIDGDEGVPLTEECTATPGAGPGAAHDGGGFRTVRTLPGRFLSSMIAGYVTAAMTCGSERDHWRDLVPAAGAVGFKGIGGFSASLSDAFGTMPVIVAGKGWALLMTCERRHPNVLLSDPAANTGWSLSTPAGVDAPLISFEFVQSGGYRWH